MTTLFHLFSLVTRAERERDRDRNEMANEA